VAVGHVHATGPVQALEEFSVKRFPDFMFVGHPFYSRRGSPSYLKRYRRGKLVHTMFAPIIKGPEPLLYVKDFLVTIGLLLRSRQRFRLYIGVDALNALAGVVLMRLGLVKRVVL
jgi:hypothetical protein